MLTISKTYHSWTPQRVLRHVGYWLAWLVFYVVVNEGVFENGNYSAWVFFEMCVLPIKLTFTYFTIYYLFPKYVEQNNYYPFIIQLAILALVGGILFRAVDYYFIGRYLITIEHFLEKINNDKFLSFQIAYKAIDLLFVVSLVLLIKLFQLQARKQKESQELLTQKLETELQYLKHQLQPHFLFNTLNNLYGMIITRDAYAGETVLKLSSIMSYMLYDTNAKFIKLGKELENLTNYIELEKLRYGEELEVSYSVEGAVEEASIAPLILIAFVENAFKHGVSKDFEKSWIQVRVEIRDGSIFFTVENSVHPGESEIKKNRVYSGVGLVNVKKRLQLLYGNRYDLQIEDADTFKVDLRITDKSMTTDV
ncbi:MAG: histidine kinase [Bacteroidota bacterium]